MPLAGHAAALLLLFTCAADAGAPLLTLQGLAEGVRSSAGAAQAIAVVICRCQRLYATLWLRHGCYADFIDCDEIFMLDIIGYASLSYILR